MTVLQLFQFQYLLLNLRCLKFKFTTFHCFKCRHIESCIIIMMYEAMALIATQLEKSSRMFIDYEAKYLELNRPACYLLTILSECLKRGKHFV